MSDGPPAERPAFLLRIDCEHTEALRWSGSAAVEVAGMGRLLDLLRELEIPATVAFVGETALAYPELVRSCLVAGHAIAGHSMRHDRAYAGQPAGWQRADLQEMVAAVEGACGVRVRGLAAPCHGLVDAATLRAAAAAGLSYVLNFPITAPGAPGSLGPAPDGPPAGHPRGVPLLVPSSRLAFVWDWTHLQPGWPAFSPAEATGQWSAAIAEAAAQGTPLSLIVHPWIVEINDEYSTLSTTLTHAREAGLSFMTFDEAAHCAAAESG
jgi:peptidoglycan/xylan/chitin deacetylase (PgdA/CDA1 family)